MANTYVKIATVSLASAAATMEFTSIPSTYTDLLLKISTRSTYAATISRAKLQINAITTGYSNRMAYGDGSGTSSTTSTDYITYLYSVGSTATASTFSNTEIYIPNYAGSNNKSVSIDSITENNATSAFAVIEAGHLANTAVITGFTISDANGSNLVQYSTATLYGIKSS